MKLNILCDSDWESRVSSVLSQLSSSGYHRLFEERDYGIGLLGIVVVIMCRDPKLNFKRRVRFAKKEKHLYMDIMLNLDQMRQAEPNVRKRTIIDRLAEEVPIVLHRYAIPDFDDARFLADFKGWLKDIGWSGETAAPSDK